MKKNKNITDYLTSILTRFLGAGLTFVTSIVVARYLGASDQGSYALALSISLMAAQFLNMGLHTANTFFKGRNIYSISELFSVTINMSVAVGILLIGLFTVLKLFFTDVFPFETLTVFWLWIATVFFIFSTWTQAFLLADQEFNKFNIFTPFF